MKKNAEQKMTPKRERSGDRDAAAAAGPPSPVAPRPPRQIRQEIAALEVRMAHLREELVLALANKQCEIQFRNMMAMLAVTRPAEDDDDD